MTRIYGDENGLLWNQPIMIKKVGKQNSIIVRKNPPPPEHYELPSFFPSIARTPRIVIDIETYDPNLKKMGPGAVRGDGYIVGIGVRTDDWQGDYFPLKHKNGPNCDAEKTFDWLRDNLRDYTGRIIGANLLYEAQWLATEGITYKKAKIDDVQWADPLLDENCLSYSLDNIAWRRLGMHKVKSELIDLYGEDFIEHFHDVHPGHAKAYVMGDIDLPLAIIDEQKKHLEKEGLIELYNLESRLYHLLVHMKLVGVRVDLEAAQRMNERIDQQRKELSSKIRYITGFDVDVWSAESMAKAFDFIGAAYPRTAPTKNRPNGVPSFTKGWLDNHPSDLAQFLNDARKCDKFNGTFVEKYILGMHHNGRIHADFHPLKRTDEDGGNKGTVTGRFSSSKPNLQNIPTRDAVFGPMMRAMFLPDEGQLWWSYDQSQMEYRLLVHFAVAANCLGAMEAAGLYRNDPKTDFHDLASLLTGLPRKAAKNINFGIVYGMGRITMAMKLGVTLAKADEILATYHGKMPFAKQLYKLAANAASNRGYIRTILSRKRRFDLWEPKAYNPGEKERPAALRHDEALNAYGQDIKRAFTHKSLNAVLQGSNADYTKMCMVNAVEAGIIGENAPLTCQLTVHDELDGSMDDSPVAREAFGELKNIMQNAIKLNVPVLVAGGIGNNWQEAHGG